MRATVESPLPALIRAALYVRLSDEDVAGKRLGKDSTAVQLDDGRAGIAAEGWSLDPRHVYVDDGISGRKTKRADWQAMLAAARRREFDVMVVRDYDRWARIHPVEAMKLIKDLADLGVKLWSYRDRQYISVEGDQVIFTVIRARQAAAEAEKAGERIRDGLRSRARDGRATGRAPYGYRIRVITDQDVRDAGDRSLHAGKWHVKYEPEIPLYHHVAAILLKTESQAATVRRLNDEKIRTPEGGTWRNASLVNLLQQPLARGYKLHKGERVEVPHLRIFSERYVMRIDEALERTTHNRPWSSAERKASTFNLAVPFIACGVCGGAIVAAGSSKGGRSYLCDRHRLRACRGIGYRSADRVDEALVRAVDATLTDEAIETVCNLVREEMETKPEVREDARGRIVRDISSTKKRVENLAEAVAEAPKAARPALYAKLGAEEERLAALKAGLARVEAAPPELDARRVVANVQKRARGLRELLAKGGPDASSAIRAVLGDKRLTAHLVTVDGKRGWKLSGRIGGLYVLDDHNGSATNLKALITGETAAKAAASATAPTTTPPAAPAAAPAAPATHS